MNSTGPCSPFLCAADLPASGECLDMVSSSVIEDAIGQASYILWRMSGGRMYGVCEETVRPTPGRCGDLTSCDAHCTVSSLKLGQTPVQRIKWVMIDGEILSPSEYRLLDHDMLIRVGDRWPHCQHLDRPLTEEGTFGIRYRFGHEVDPITKQAGVDLVMEFIKLAVPGDRARRLPGAVASASSQGLSFSMQDRNTLVREMGSYLESVNRFMSFWNPTVQPETYVYSPDTSPRLAHLDGMG